MTNPFKWYTIYKAREEQGDAYPQCSACRKSIMPWSRISTDIFDRKLHARCAVRANMAPELVLLVRALISKQQGFAAFTKREIFASPPVIINKTDNGIELMAQITE
jgi:hypothetical protein